MHRAHPAVLVLAALLLVGVPNAAAAQESATADSVSVKVTAHPIESFDPRDPARKRFGDLEFRSGLVLSSPFKGFGGLSAIRLDADGRRFVALSDKGDWFTGAIVYRGKAMTGMENVVSAPMLGSDGRPIRARGWFDSEALAVDGQTLYVGLERVNRILRFDFAQGGIGARGVEIAVPPAIRKLPFNLGIEGMAFVPKGLPLAGTLLALSERGLDADGNLLGFLIGGPTPGQFSLRRTAKFDVSDCTLLPSGDLLVLERKFSLADGIGIRIRRIALGAIAPGALVDGPSIFEADLGYEIDNMEGLDVHRDADGSLVLTMVSDDNFSMLQRTLLLQFTLMEP